jgi:RHS repeat-associated protein
VYDNSNRLTSRQFGGSGQTPLRIDLGYSTRNELTSLTRYSDLAGAHVVGTTAYGYDSSSRVTSIVNQNASNATLSYYNYAYDSSNRVTSHTWQSGSTPGAQTYSYDASTQLLGDGTATFSYDPNGNRTMTGYRTGTANQLTTDAVWTYTYDREGNEIQKSKGANLETWYYGYDTLDHLTSVRQTSDGSTNLLLVTYTYDVFGNRAQEAKWTSGTGTVTTRHQYDGSNVWADTDTSNSVQARYVWGDGVNQIFARIEPTGQPNPGVAWDLTDDLGSVRDLMDSTGALRDHLDYSGYGVVTETSPSYGDQNKYAAGKYDTSTGLVQFGRRWYDAATGRWLEQDPLGFGAGDTNLYRYVSNTPTSRTDPSGLRPPQDANYGQHIAMAYYESMLLQAMYKSRWTGQPLDPGAVLRAMQAYRGSINSYNMWLRNHPPFFASPEQIEQRVPLPNSTLIQMWDQTFDGFHQERQTSFRQIYYLAMVGMIWTASGPGFVSPSGKTYFLRAGKWLTEAGDEAPAEEAAAANAANREQWQEHVDALQDKIDELQDKIQSIQDAEYGYGPHRVGGSLQELKELMNEMAHLMANKPQ